MQGDITRSTFQPQEHYRTVRQQQGRVGLDADWNEQAEITAYRAETEALDVIGPCGAPKHDAGFEIIDKGGGDFAIGPGRIYVDGILCENESSRPVLFTRQPELRPGALSGPGRYLVYLDVWLRHISALDNPYIREVALGGPDTATRAKVVWQVKALPVESAIGCASEPEGWKNLIKPSAAKLRARAKPDEKSDQPCILPPGAGYRRLENQLYRVEIHRGGTVNDSDPSKVATFKWSRDNGSVASRIMSIGGGIITLSSARRDSALGFAPGQWIELLDDRNEWNRTPGVLVPIVKVDDLVLTVDKSQALSDPEALSQFETNFNEGFHPKARRWDSVKTIGATIPSENEGFLPLEDGVEVKFDAGLVRTGDHWLIPARTAKGNVEWPQDSATSPKPLPQLPHGIAHHFCRLAIIEVTRELNVKVIDCRRFFLPVTELTSLFYVSGDGQEALPGHQLPKPLQVGVANGQWPVGGARVKFTVAPGNGTLQLAGSPMVSSTATELVVQTGADGVADCKWTLDAVTPSQQVVARLLNAADASVHLPVRFNASFSDERQPAVHILQVNLIKNGPLINDTDVSVSSLASGIGVVCDAPIDPGCISVGNPSGIDGNPTCFLVLDLPFPANGVDRDFWGTGKVVGFKPLILAAKVSIDTDSSIIKWEPPSDTQLWLKDMLFKKLNPLNITRILARFTLKGNFVWSEGNSNLYLDGEASGFRETGSPNINERFTGDGRRGGDFEMWFWLVPGENAPPSPVIVAPGGAINFSNLVTPGLSAPVFDVDGRTALSDPFVAQLFVEIEPPNLVAIGSPRSFRNAGFWEPDMLVVRSAVSTRLLAKVRVWDGSVPTFEEALAAGFKHGESNALTIQVVPQEAARPLPAATLTGLQSFKLTER